MKTEKALLIALACAALAAGSAAAQTELGDAFDAARAAVAAAPKTPAAPASAVASAPAAAVASCDDAKELETSFELTVAAPNGGDALDLKFQYAGCDWAPRNDYLPPYTERAYKAQDGYGLTIVTNDGEGVSEVLLSKGKDWVGRLGAPANAAMASGDPVAIDLADFQDYKKPHSKATLRDSAKPYFPQLKACEASAAWGTSGTFGPSRDASGKPTMGWDGRGYASLVLLTKTAAYYYHEDCDICAEVTRCDLTSGALTSAVRAHSVDCSDMKKYRSEADVVYDSCN
jgi:hypothetical protein